jgi:DNA mismatch endonuclease (patch repair protein)
MKGTRRRDTAPEIALRSELHRLGLRFRVDRSPLPGGRRRADIVFGPARVAVYVHGCFWHGCPEHATWPKANAEWWREKIEANRRRDADTDARLHDAGWLALRVWEHEDPAPAAERIATVVAERTAVPPARTRRNSP